jgi:hypothetical protein
MRLKTSTTVRRKLFRILKQHQWKKLKRRIKRLMKGITELKYGKVNPVNICKSLGYLISLGKK